jgi:hypothetical protein
VKRKKPAFQLDPEAAAQCSFSTGFFCSFCTRGRCRHPHVAIKMKPSMRAILQHDAGMASHCLGLGLGLDGLTLLRVRVRVRVRWPHIAYRYRYAPMHSITSLKGRLESDVMATNRGANHEPCHPPSIASHHGRQGLGEHASALQAD